MIRNLLAAVIGGVSSAILWFGLLAAWYLVGYAVAPTQITLPPPNRPPTIVWWLAGTLVCDAAMGLVAGYVICRLAKKPAHKLIAVVAVLMVIGLIVQAAQEYNMLPLWVSVTRLGLVPVAMWYGARLHGMSDKRLPTTA